MSDTISSTINDTASGIVPTSDQTSTQALMGRRAEKFVGGKGRRLVLVVTGVIISLIALGPVTRLVAGPGPSGPNSSSFSTNPLGVAAFTDLAKQNGFAITQLRTDLSAAELAKSNIVLRSTDTLVVFETRITVSEQDNVRSFVEQGGRVVASGVSDSWLAGLANVVGDFEQNPSTNGQGNVGGTTLRLALNGSGFWSASEGIDRAARGERTIVVEQIVNSGRVVAIADPSFLDNTNLASVDNAAFALSLLGSTDRRIFIAEAGHGYGTSSSGSSDDSQTGIPSNVKLFLFGLACSFLLWAISVGRRNGPPERADRDLPPARNEYALAMTATLQRQQRAQRRPSSRASSNDLSNSTSFPSAAATPASSDSSFQRSDNVS